MTATETKPVRILIVDDHLVTRMGLRVLLAEVPAFQVVGEADSGAEAIDRVEELTPDLLLLDMRLRDGDGTAVCRRLRELGVPAKILILSSYSDEQTVMNALEAGADGYLLKEIDGDALVRAIQSVMEGKSVLDPAVTGRVLMRIKSGLPAPANPPGKLDLLSAQEMRVIEKVSEGKTNKQIGQELGLSDKTVKNYLSNALEKLEMSTRTEAAAYYITHQHASMK